MSLPLFLYILNHDPYRPLTIRNLLLSFVLPHGKYAINGTVKGDKGSCNVRSISAGGYNIQCWHIRTIIR